MPFFLHPAYPDRCVPAHSTVTALTGPVHASRLCFSCKPSFNLGNTQPNVHVRRSVVLLGTRGTLWVRASSTLPLHADVHVQVHGLMQAVARVFLDGKTVGVDAKRAQLSAAPPLVAARIDAARSPYYQLAAKH